jgi:hypothetical protein
LASLQDLLGEFAQVRRTSPTNPPVEFLQHVRTSEGLPAISEYTIYTDPERRLVQMSANMAVARVTDKQQPVTSERFNSFVHSPDSEPRNTP